MSLANILAPEHSSSNPKLPTFQPGTRKKLEHFSYALDDIIGKGYSSQVFKGKNDNTNQPVAIKVIDMKMLKCEVNRSLLNNEIENLKSLGFTPAVLKLHEVYNTRNNTYIITELCDSDLSKAVKKRLDENQSHDFSQQLIEGYLHLWRKGVIHRDLKPANVLLKEKCVKIADFGFSISAKEAMKPSKYNVGSPLYMAPESLKKNEYSFKSDIWALGVIVYEMLFSQPPWRAKNEKQLIKKIEAESIHSLLSSNPAANKICSSCRDFLIRTLSIDKQVRMSPEELEKFNFHFRSPVDVVLAPSNLVNVASTPIYNSNNSTTTQKYHKVAANENTTTTTNKQSGFSFTIHHIHLNKTVETITPQKNNNNHSNNESVGHRSVLPENIHPGTEAQQNERSVRENRKKIFTEDQKQQQQPNLRTQTLQASPSPALMTRDDRKNLSKILISEVHFCRFLYKLINRIKTQVYLPNAEELIAPYCGIIMHKITNIKDFEHFNFLNTEYFEEYKTSTDFAKIKKIGKEYYVRYSEELGQYHEFGTPMDIHKAIETTVKFIKSLASGLTEKVSPSTIDEMAQEIIVLDYLITTYQLLGLLKDREDYARFAKKSKIQEIVEGTPSGITLNHFKKIMVKIEDLKLSN